MDHKGTLTIETERLVLRRFYEEDAKTAYINWTSDKKMTKYLRWSAHSSANITIHLINDWVKSYSKKDFYQWAICLQEKSTESIGAIGVTELNENTKMCSLGYCIGSKW